MDLNPRLRGRISLFNNLIGDKCGKVSFGTISQFGDSMSSTMFSQPTQTVTAQSITLEEFISVNEIKDCNFIKMDIEGSEVMVLPDIRDYLRANKPTLLLSLHPHLFKNMAADSRAITGVLESCYRYLYSDVGESLTVEKIKDRLARNKGFTVLATDHKWPVFQRATHFLEKLFFYISKKIDK
jgi:FkbM family methyltransferase